MFLLAAAIAMLLASAAVSAQERTTLRKVEILGLQRRPADEVIATSGLNVGDPINASMIDAAADKLMRSGWFQSVDYRVRNADGDTTVIFQVVEKVGAINVAAGETLGQVAWSGNTTLSSEELSTVFGLRAGDLVPQTKIDEGLGRIRKAYARRGYINAQITYVTRNLDVRRRNYQFTIREGQQYRMGLLSITGLAPAETRQLTNKWTLAPNTIFDDSYLDQFRTAVLRPFVASRAQRTGIRSRFEINTKPDTQKQTVDVIISFK
jgi:outer membrane protein insertion porin family